MEAVLSPGGVGQNSSLDGERCIGARRGERGGQGRGHAERGEGSAVRRVRTPGAPALPAQGRSAFDGLSCHEGRLPDLGGRISRGPPRPWKPARSLSDVRPARPDGGASANIVHHRGCRARAHGACGSDGRRLAGPVGQGMGRRMMITPPRDRAPPARQPVQRPRSSAPGPDVRRPRPGDARHVRARRHPRRGKRRRARGLPPASTAHLAPVRQAHQAVASLTRTRTAPGHEDAAWLRAAGSRHAPRHQLRARFCARPQPARDRACLKDRAAGAGGSRGTTRSGSWQPRWAGQSGRLNGLERLDLLGLRALGPPPGGVLNPLVVLKAAVTVSLDSGMVNEDVAGASCTVKNLRCGEETP
jgi:hypothetical protein